MAGALCTGSACGQPMHVLHVFLPQTVFTLAATERLEFVAKCFVLVLNTLTVLLPSCPQLLLLWVPIPWDCLTFLERARIHCAPEFMPSWSSCCFSDVKMDYSSFSLDLAVLVIGPHVC